MISSIMSVTGSTGHVSSPTNSAMLESVAYVLESIGRGLSSDQSTRVLNLASKSSISSNSIIGEE